MTMTDTGETPGWRSHPARGRLPLGRRVPGRSSPGPGSLRRWWASLAQVLAFEWTKCWSTRSTLWMLVAAGLVLPVMAVFVAVTGSIQPDDTVLGGSLTGAVLAQMVAAVFGALVVAGEYSSGMIRTTLTASPRRSAVLAAKATVVGGSVLALTLAGSGLAFAIGTLMLDGDRYAPGDPCPALLGVALAISVTGLLGLAVGTVLRHPAGAVAAVLAIILLPSLFGPLFGDLERWVGGASPAAVLQKLTQTSDVSPETVGSLEAWPSLLVFVLYVAAALVGSGWLLRSRDA